MSLLSSIANLSFLLSSSGGEGAHEAATFLGLPINLWQGVNLVLFIALLVWALRKPVAGFFGGRTEEVEKTLKKAEERREAEEEQTALLKAADEDATRIVERARGELDARVRAARKELTAYAGDLAVGVARDILARAVTADDEVRLRTEGVAALVEGGAPRGA